MANTQKTTKNSRAQAKARLEEERRRQRATERRRTQIWVAASVVVVLVLVGSIAYFVQKQRSDKGHLVKPPNATANWAVAVGSADAPVTIDAYEDFQCPNCEIFERASGATMQSFIDGKKAIVNYHTLRFIDFNVGGDYSLRAANAATCADEEGKFKQYHSQLFANYPGEGKGGLSDAQLVALGKNIGITSSSFASCVKDQTYSPWVQRVQDEASKAGVNGTPTIIIDGKKLTDLSPKGLTTAVAAATVAAKK